LQRRTTREAYFGVRIARTFTDVRATFLVVMLYEAVSPRRGDVPPNKYAKKVIASLSKASALPS
jgi:hypothetical protein